MNGTWPIPDILYDALHQCFNIQRVIHCNPINLPLRAKTYISHDPRDTRFSATPYTHTAWPDTSLALPEYTPYRLKQALEQAIYSAHAHRHTSPSSQVLILPNWEHSPYLARNLHSTYAQKLTSIPYYPIYNKQPNTSKPKLNIYLIANEKALALLNHQHITNTLRLALTKLTGKTTPITLNLKQKDPRHIDSHTTYTEQYPYTQNPQYTPLPLIYKKFHAAWDPKRFVYTDGSQKRGNPTLGAAIVNPETGITYHIESKSQEERHTINRAELAAITLALDLHKEESTLQILTDSAFSINTLRNYAINPLRYTHHTHKDLLAHTNNIIKTRDAKGYTTHIGKVKSHTGVTYNDAADTGACAVVDGDILPDIIFTQADPPLGGLRTWPYTQNQDTINHPKHKLTNLHTSLRKLVKTQTYNNHRATNTIYSNILKQARHNGADHTIHAYSTTPYRARRDALEVAWGVHIHRCSSKSGPTPTCSKCQAPLNNTHLLGGCSHTAKLRTKRHNNTFLLLHQLLQKSNGGRWPVIGIDLGKTPITDFRNTKPKTDDTPLSNLPPITHPEQEGLQDDKNAAGETPHIIP